MNHQTNSDVSARIGALELGAINFFDDSALEASIQGPPRTNPFVPGAPCGSDDRALEATVHAGPSTHLRRSTVCLNIDDRALEATVQAGPNAQVTLLRNSRRGCEFVDVTDGALEVAAAIFAGPSSNPRFCYNIDDGALEGSAASAMSPTQVSCLPIPTQKWTHCVGDGALEASVHAGPQRPTGFRLPNGACLPGVDDGALESAADLHLGPTGMTCPPPQTLRPMCRYIDDGALEASVLSMVNPTLDPRCRTRGCY